MRTPPRQLAKGLLAVAASLLLASFARANTDLNQVGAFLVYPVILTPGASADVIETYVTITNAGGSEVQAHIVFVNGTPLDGPDPKLCYECDFNLPLTPGDTEVLVITQATHPDTGAPLDFSNLEALDAGIQRSCDWTSGFLTVALKNPAGETIGNNVLVGEEVVVNFTKGSAYSIPAVTFQGVNVDADNVHAFDDSEYKAFPSVVAADFVAPDLPGEITGMPGVLAELFLFTLNFETEAVPATSCDVIGFDAAEHYFSNSLQFGCWGSFELCDDVQAEFCYGFLGEANGDDHGWVQLICEVDGSQGGVHGAIVQTAQDGALVRRAPMLSSLAPSAVAADTQWARLLYQSMTAGDGATFTTVPNPGPGL